MSSERIAIVGIGLRYPDANTPEELWENVLAGRRAFRRLPDERMNRADYWSADPATPDRFYSEKAAVLRDFEFDRVRYKVAGSTYRATDLTHWLALDVATQALADAGFPEGAGLPRQATGVVLGNSLTGEFSRANIMRLRWPYVRRTVAAALAGKGWSDDETAEFLRELEVQYKAPFPAINEDSLAGGLANTIAGRICNHFDLGGGGYTVDGACSSSLLSVATAANALAEGDLDVVLAGGVDLSIDPFEVIGFAKTGALATGEMKVYDKDSNGFWPGEGSGLLVLMRERDALDRGARIYATITGWGVSSDGKGGITRPEASGHRLALTRAYGRAGYGVETVSYFEGHGTGTAVGDATEIEALSTARRAADPTAVPAALSTVKGNFGHTKAAAGVAGLIKAALAVHHQVIPPATGHHDPHPLLTAADAAMYVPATAAPWPTEQPVRAGVSAMGFGGINSHVAIEQAPDAARRDRLDQRVVDMVTGRQDAELLMVDAADVEALREQVARLVRLVPRLAMAELTDLAGALAGELSGRPARAAVVVTGPDDAERKLTRLLALLDEGEHGVFAAGEGVFLAHAAAPPKIAFLFPGQGSGRGAAGAIRRRFPSAEDVFRTAGLPADGDQVATEVAQPRIVTGSLAALRVLHALGVDADTAVGHSLGELTALHWGGAMSETELLRLAAVRGRVMAEASRGDGAMAGLAASPDQAAGFFRDDDVVIAGYNAPRQTVVSGPAEAVDRVCTRARAAGVTATRINVSHAFHSPSVEPAALAMAEHLAGFDFGRLTRPVLSTVTGDVLHAAEDLRALLQDQVVLPVRFREAAAKAAERADLVLEVGPGRVLTGLLAEIAPGKPVLPVDTDSGSLVPLLRVLGAAFALGAPVRADVLFADRVVRPLSLDGEFTFLASPCEAAPAIDAELTLPEGVPAPDVATEPAAESGANTTLELLRRLAAERVELPLETVTADTHPLDDLHLSSITVGQIVNEVTRALGRPALDGMPNFATVCLGDLAEMIDELAETARSGDDPAGEVPGVAPWVRPFAVEYVEAQRPAVDLPGGGTTSDWSVHAPPGHPLAEPLRVALAEAGVGDGVLLCLPAECGAAHAGLFLDAGRAVLAAPTGTRFVVVQQGLGASGLAKTLRLEDPSARTTIVELPDVVPGDAASRAEAIGRVVAETAATTDFAEVRYTADGARTVPVLRAVPAPVSATEPGTDVATSPLDASDVLLVTGGGKGITAECALAVAQDSGAALALLGRADPAEDTELAGNLARLDAAGVRYAYQRADVTSAEQVAAAVEEAQAALGPVTAVLHGAGRNEPAALFSLTEETFRATLAPKIDGLRAVLAAVDADRIKLLVTFGSIIGRAGLRGEAHYATANDWMSELTARFQREHPGARALALEWSVWSGAGMGEKLGVVEALMRDGITPVSTENGIAVLRQVLADPAVPPVLVVGGRTGGLPTLPLERRELPLTRFVDRVLVHYPGVELVTEADLSAGSDPYLADHLLDGDLLFPAVMGMEAMTQIASAVTGAAGPPLLENVEFLRPVVVPVNGSTTVRLAALARDTGTVDVVIRSAETGFSADHFRATLRFPRPDVPGEPAAGESGLPVVPVDPVAELYGGVLFQGKRFQRLTAYRRASARHAVAEIATRTPAPWFAPFLPQQQLLADPGTRDAMMHAIQCCVPDATLLPQGIERLYLADPADQDTDYVVLDARERSQDGDSYVYDLDVRAPSGAVVERWEGLSLRAVRKRDGAGPWVPTMLGSYLERALERVLGGGRAVVVEPDPAGVPIGSTSERRKQTELAVSRAENRPVRLRYRPDGKPEADGVEVSASHGAGLTMAVVGDRPLTCDLESAVDRGPQDWASLLGPELLAVRDLVAVEADEAMAVASTRVWSAMECVRKTGSMTQALTVDTVRADGWVLLSAGEVRVATWATTVEDRAEPVVFAVLEAGRD
ncbi:enediyne polyketide synthase [Amycolatopsis arida]|uniref:Enediyne polyketide synthase n=1 Tax=Amycolatopsis arida TaxID=587909 RepID=A0A1I5MHX0_9PSEU|nr:type I polyketide synthase [Amycolatopsis arida]TDX94100.1 enediyne polyketide synthase [Amycolatopsis arida]SFP09110.1 enediyne polyketide synthase [Amycolatopsis arida]